MFFRAFRSWSSIRFSLFTNPKANNIQWSVQYSTYRKYANKRTFKFHINLLFYLKQTMIY